MDRGIWLLIGNLKEKSVRCPGIREKHLIGASYMTMNHEFYEIVSEEISQIRSVLRNIPDMFVLENYFKKKAADDEQKKLLETLKGKENVTRSGRKINLYANIGNPGDLVSVMENDAGGIGLFRSEFLYLESDYFPTEEEQFQAYKRVVETMGGRKVIIRTLDIAADTTLTRTFAQMGIDE